MFDRIAPVYDLMNRVMTVGLDQRWRRLTVRVVVPPGDRVLDACCGTGDLAVASAEGRRRRRRARLLRSGCSSGRGASDTRSSGSRATCSSCPSRTRPSTRRPSASASATSPTSSAGLPSCGACCGRAAGSRSSRSRSPRGPLRPFYRLWFDGPVPLLGQDPPGREGLHLSPRERPPLSRAGRAGRADRAAAASARSRSGCLGGGIVALHTGTAAMTHARGRPPAPGLDSYLEQVETRLAAAVGSYPGRVAEVGADALAAGGKRLRPLLAFLSAPPDAPPPVAAGVAVELVHMATLVHDDLIDGATVRRGKSGGLGGARPRRSPRDRRLPLRARLRGARRRRATSTRVAVLADASLCLARGEAMQRRQRDDPDTTGRGVPRALRAQDRQALRGRLLARRPAARSARFGLNLGIAFQIADDILDCSGDTIETGKVAGTDLREGTPTLPLLLAAQEDEAVRDGARGRAARGRARCASRRPARSSAPGRWRSTTLRRRGRA